MLLVMSNDEFPEVTSFGHTADGVEVRLYTVRSGAMEATFCDYGARVVSLKVPDAQGQVAGVGAGL